MNILNPAELKGPELRRLTESLQRHSVTQIETTKDGVKTLLVLNSGRWQTIKKGMTSTLIQTKKGWRVQRTA